MSSKALLSGTKYAINKCYRKLGQRVIKKATQPIIEKNLRTVLLKSKIQDKVLDFLENYYINANPKQIKTSKGEEALGKLLLRETRTNSLEDITDNKEEEDGKASSSNF